MLITVALEEGFGLKGEPPPDNTSAGTKRHQLSLSININQWSGSMWPDEPDDRHFLLSSLPHSWLTLCLFVRLSLWGVCWARWAAGGSPASYNVMLPSFLSLCIRVFEVLRENINRYVNVFVEQLRLHSFCYLLINILLSFITDFLREFFYQFQLKYQAYFLAQ